MRLSITAMESNAEVLVANDVSAGSFAFQKVRLALAGAYNILTAASYQRATALAAEREGRYASFRPSSSHEMSILSTVVGITQEVGDIAINQNVGSRSDRKSIIVV